MSGDSTFLLLILFQLKISLNLECPELSLGTGYDAFNDERHFGACKSGLKGVSDKLFLRAYLDKLRVYTTTRHSVFGANLHRAIRSALGSPKCMQSDALSLSGYIFDFEVLLDGSGEPIHIPIQWKHRLVSLLEASIGKGRSRPVRMKISEDLVDSMRDSERDAGSSGGTGNTIPLDRYQRRPTVNLASDWGARFYPPSKVIARRVVVEADGHHHYAINCDHLLGSTVLKRRQVRALGWEVLNVSMDIIIII